MPPLAWRLHGRQPVLAHAQLVNAPDCLRSPSSALLPPQVSSDPDWALRLSPHVRRRSGDLHVPNCLYIRGLASLPKAVAGILRHLIIDNIYKCSVGLNIFIISGCFTDLRVVICTSCQAGGGSPDLHVPAKQVWLCFFPSRVVGGRGLGASWAPGPLPPIRGGGRGEDLGASCVRGLYKAPACFGARGS